MLCVFWDKLIKVCQQQCKTHTNPMRNGFSLVGKNPVNQKNTRKFPQSWNLRDVSSHFVLEMNQQQQETTKGIVDPMLAIPNRATEMGKPSHALVMRWKIYILTSKCKNTFWEVPFRATTRGHCWVLPKSFHPSCLDQRPRLAPLA